MLARPISATRVDVVEIAHCDQPPSYLGTYLGNLRVTHQSSRGALLYIVHTNYVYLESRPLHHVKSAFASSKVLCASL